MKRLENKVAVVTGGGAGIGKATAKKFAGEGASVVVAEFNEASGRATESELKQAGMDVSFIPTDVGNKQSIQALFDEVKKRFGSLDILVNNAGITIDKTLKKLEEEDFEKVMDVNLKGVYLCARAAAELMKENDSGVILNASSVVAHYGNFGQTNYVAAKSGVIGMTKVWARELGKHNIRVNAVAPGFIQTSMIENMPEKVLKMMGEKTCLNRLGKAEDVANMYCFLASDEAAYVTGAVFNVDGGLVV